LGFKSRCSKNGRLERVQLAGGGRDHAFDQADDRRPNWTKVVNMADWRQFLGGHLLCSWHYAFCFTIDTDSHSRRAMAFNYGKIALADTVDEYGEK
jgi:hypothetical protein